MKIYVLVGLATVLVSGCAINKFTANTTAGMLSAGAQAFNEESDLAFAKEAMPANIKMMEGLLKSSPKNQVILSMLAQSYCSYAFAFLEDSDKKDEVERAKAFYLRGYRYGLTSLPTQISEFATGDLEQFEKAVTKIDSDDIPNLFWTAYCLGSWVNISKTEVDAVAALSRTEIMMHQVLEHNPAFYHGGPQLFYGVFYGARPRMLGGNQAKAKEHIEKAIGLTNGKFLLAKLYLAQFYAVPTQDEGLFDKTLKEILDASEDLYPEERLANLVAKKRAAKLLNMKKELF